MHTCRPWGGTPEEVAAEDLDAEQKGESPLLCLRDGKSKGLYPYLVPRKGTDFSLAEKLARQVCADLDRMAYPRVLFRSDNEASLNSFLRVIKQMWGGEVVRENSSEGDPQSNGGAECGVGLAKGLIKTVKGALESHIQTTIPADHPILIWIC